MPPGVLYALSAYAFYSSGDAIIKGLGGGLSPFEIAFSTALASLIPVILATWREENWLEFWRVKHPKLVHLRAFSGMVSNIAIVYAFVTIPLAEAYSLAFLAPIFVVALATSVLGERVSAARWAFLAISFGGVLLVVQPGFNALHLGHLTALIAAFAGATTTSVMRKIAPIEKRSSIIGIATFYILVFNGVMMLWTRDVHPLNWEMVGKILAVGATGGLGNLFYIAATRNAAASVVAPMQYSQLIWALLFGAVFYLEVPNQLALVGLVVIIAAGLGNVLETDVGRSALARLLPTGRGLRTIREADKAIDVVLEAPVAGAAEITTNS